MAVDDCVLGGSSVLAPGVSSFCIYEYRMDSWFYRQACPREFSDGNVLHVRYRLNQQLP